MRGTLRRAGFATLVLLVLCGVASAQGVEIFSGQKVCFKKRRTSRGEGRDWRMRCRRWLLVNVLQDSCCVPVLHQPRPSNPILR